VYKEIEEYRGRPLFVYAVKFPFPPLPKNFPVSPPISIDLEDIDGFTDLVNAEKKREQLDVLIHSPGGSPEATERIVSLLRSNYQEINFLIPHSAYSAATMLALSGDQIIMHPSASLGPIDPQINGVPARATKKGFERAKKTLIDEGPEALPAFVPLIEKYSLQLLEICDDYELLAKELVIEWMSTYMFKGDQEKNDLIEKAAEYFSNYETHKTHGRSLTFNKISGLGLNIVLAEPPLDDLLREAHILLNGFFQGTPFVKVYENSDDLSWGKQFHVEIDNRKVSK